MFNSYSYSQGGQGGNASNNLKINAVSGNLVKNHPMSIFVIAKTDSTLFDPTNPRYNFKIDPQIVTKFRRQGHWNNDAKRWEDEYYDETVMCDKEVPCTVLQAMIIGDGLFLCEIVKTSDFFGPIEIPSAAETGEENA